MNRKQNVYLFTIPFLFSMLLYRSVVFIKQGRVSFLREVTGLQVHHYHYGVLLVVIAFILILFHKISTPAIMLSGFGTGAILDSFVSSLFMSTTRAEEIVNYQNNLIPTIILFLGVILIVVSVGRNNNTRIQ